MNEVRINIANDFSKYPAGRFKEDGEFSAERFRDDLLIPKMQEYDLIIVCFDGTAPYGSSFLEEAFGGLIRKGMDIKKLELESKDSLLIKEIQTYMDKAKK